MYPIKPTVGFEPVDPYEKAKRDILTAIDALKALSPVQWERLAKELFGAANVAAAAQWMQCILCGNNH